MNKKPETIINKGMVVASMAKKLAKQPALESFGKRKKKIPAYLYVISAVIALSITFTFYSLFHQRKETELKKMTIATIKERENPLFLLDNALKQDSISVDQYALYLRDILIRYDSLPQKYKTNKPVILNDEVYHSILNVWMSLSAQVRRVLVKDIPDLSNRIEQLKDSLGIR